MGSNIVPLIGFGIILLFGGIFVIVINSKNKKSKGTKEQIKESNKNTEVSYKHNQAQNINKEDIFKFMEFEKIQDDMIISQNGNKCTAVIKCKGINYNLMSEVEQLSVEEGFINFLNTLKFPIQLYVQAQTINLTDNINKYKKNMESMEEEYEDVNLEYNRILSSLEYLDEEIEEVENRKNSLQNVIEYGEDIVRYVERLSLNKSMLQRNFYVLVSYYKSEITNSSSFKKEELEDIAFTELFTRVENILSGLHMSSVSGYALNSNEIAELLYTAYNRDDSNYINVQQALESGFHRLYSTSEDAITKKRKMLIETINKEAEYKAAVALKEALESGNVSTIYDVENQFDEEVGKQAIEIIKNEKVPEPVKKRAKKKIIDEYKETKLKRQDELQKKLKDIEENIEVNTKETPEEIVELNEQNNSDNSDDEALI